MVLHHIHDIWYTYMTAEVLRSFYKSVKTLFFLSDFFLVFYSLGFYSSVKNVSIIFIT